VARDLESGVLHIGIVADRKSPDTRRYMIVHNSGQGPRLEDVLFDRKIVGHYRYFGPRSHEVLASALRLQLPSSASAE